jgi:hypothetical protein
VAIAKSYGAHVTTRQFDNWSEHQNWGLKNIPFRYGWVFYLDADERVTSELASSLQKAVRNPGDTSGFRVRRRDFFMGTWLKHTQTSPLYIRLFQPNKMRYERLVNPISIVNGQVGQVTGYLDHFPFSKGIGHWLERHNAYSSLEAAQIFADRQNRNHHFSLYKALLVSDFHERRVHQKILFYKLPFKPLIIFLSLYIAKLGFLDGKAGLTYSTLRAIYEYMIVLKAREIDQREQS